MGRIRSFTEKTTYNQTNLPTPAILTEIARHEADLMPDADEDPADIEVDPNEEVTGIELYQASVTVREVAKEEKQPLPDLEEHPDGHKNPEKLEALQRDRERIMVVKRASREHKYFTAMDSTGEYKSTPVMCRSLLAERLKTLGAYRIEPAQVKITLCIGGNHDNQIFVSERTSMDYLRKIVSAHFQGTCRVQPDQFPLPDGTQVLVIP
jgi:hypothetical protein